MQRKIIAIMLAALMVASVSSGCKKRDAVNSSSSSLTESSSAIGTLDDLIGTSSSDKENNKSSSEQGGIEFNDGTNSKPSQPVIKKDAIQGIKESKAINKDVVAWLSIDGTSINDPILWKSGDNTFYERKNLKGEYDFNGSYWIDYECKIGDREKLSKNTIIYGHSMDDDANGKMFSQLKKFLNIDFAKTHPYFTYTTETDTMVWEIFMVGYVDTSLMYNYPNLDDALYPLLIEELKNRSDYDYKVEVNKDDKIMVLSTCTYPNGLVDDAASKQTRYLVCGRLVDKGEQLKNTAQLEVNPNPKAPKIKK